jgi:uncharacterized protein (TIGR00369 family)
MTASFGFIPDPDNPGWHVRPVNPEGRFIDMFGVIRARAEPDGKVRVRVETGPSHRNIFDQVHGGFTLALVDQALFVAPAILGIEGAVGAATIDTTTQFLGPLVTGKPVDAVVEVLRETGRMLFMRGLIEQDGVTAISFSGTIKKAR